MANALATSSSPYLRQHAENPVDWQPWSQAALDRAAAEDKPLLISIGYSACHWCHVMAHESFEDPATAALMNAHFVCIKVDREERPDLDAIYLDACQSLTGQGGWPLHAFATPDGRPFYAGTYFPPQPGRGLPGWSQLLEALAEAWRERRDEIEETGTSLGAALGGAAHLTPVDDVPGGPFLDAALHDVGKQFDSVHGGFGGAPKFPPSALLGFLLQRGGDALPMARYTLASMASGGIFDQVGGGFARYAVDRTWTVPHFEKMLSDNALLAARYAEAATITGDASFGRVAERTLDWVVTDLGDEDGGFASALDADSAGAEGTFYVWTPAQLRAALDPDDADVAAAWFGVTDEGNFDGGATVLEERGIEPEPATRDRILGALAQAREQRERPARDDKRIVSWNALAIQGFVASGVRLGRADHLAAATRCAELILERACDARGRVLRLIPRPGDDLDQLPAGVLEDHAHLLEALVALYEATFEARWFDAARELAGVLLRDFADVDRGGFFTTARDHEQLVARRKELDDNPVPSGQASAAVAMLRLHALTGDAQLLAAAEGVLRLGASIAGRGPGSFGHFLRAIDQYNAAPVEIAVVGEGSAAEALIAVAREQAPATAVIAAGLPGTATRVPLLAGRELIDGQAAAYVCERFSCQRPVTTPEELRTLLLRG